MDERDVNAREKQDQEIHPILQTYKMVAVRFAEWIRNNNYDCRYCKPENKWLYVHYLVFTELRQRRWNTDIKNKHGKTTEELYDMFLAEEKERLTK